MEKEKDREKLVVEVVRANSLMPKDGQGSTSAFAEVEFDGRRQRTRVVDKDLNPLWNERLHFPLNDPWLLPSQTIDVFVYNQRRDGHRNNFLGKVRVHGSSVARNANADRDPPLQRYPLEKRSLFSLVKGDISLKIYTVAPKPEPKPPTPTTTTPATPPVQTKPKSAPTPEIKPKPSPPEPKPKPSPPETKPKPKPKSKPKAKESPVPSPRKEPPVVAVHAVPARTMDEKRLQHSRPPVVVHMSAPAPAPASVPASMPVPVPPLTDYALKEAAVPPTPRKAGGNGAAGHRLVEHMEYLYVHVVKARHLPADACPYVEARVGNYRGTTKHFEYAGCPEWNQVFAFSKDRIAASYLEVFVCHKGTLRDDMIGRVAFDLSEVPARAPPDSPLAPQWYVLEDRRGELMLAVWLGTQADEAFSEAWHSDAAAVASAEALAHTKSKVYLSPKLWYVRVNVIEAQDLMAKEPSVRVQLGNQQHKTGPIRGRGTHLFWNEDIVLVAAEPFEDAIVVTVVDHVGPNRDEIVGRAVLSLSKLERRTDHRAVPPRWFPLDRPNDKPAPMTGFSSRIHLRVCLDGGYHVLDESTHYSSDLRPTARQLWKPSIGILELGIIGAGNLAPMKTKGGRGTTDAYCVAKYGNKWVRTRTLMDTLNPTWNEQYTWEVFDPCTVVTVAVFDNNQLYGAQLRENHIGKVRIRISTLEADRVYRHVYPLLALHPSGVKKLGELELAVRFSCTSMAGVMGLYFQPLLPRMHYLQPLSVLQVEMLRGYAMQIVAARLARAEPPLRREVVEYVLDADAGIWSMRRSKANFVRVMSLLSGAVALGRWLHGVQTWRSPATTVLVHILLLILIVHPHLILPTLFLYVFLIGLWRFRFRPRQPPAMDARLSCADAAHPDELDEEMDTWPTSRSWDVVRNRYDRLRSVAGRVQTVVGDMATQGERLHSLLAWRDPRATALFLTFCLAAALVLYSLPFQTIAFLLVVYTLRHPRFRRPLPSAPLNFFRRLPAKTDCLL